MTGDTPPFARHVLTLAASLDGGGAERAMLRLAGAWGSAGRRVTLLTPRGDGPLLADIPPGVELVRVRAPRAALAGAAARLRPDVIFLPANHYTSAGLAVRALLGRTRPPLVAKLSNALRRGDHGRLRDAGHRTWTGLHGRFLDRLVAMTLEAAAEAGERCRMAGRIAVIPNPPRPPVPPGTAAGTELPPGRFVLGVGRLAPQKRWDLLLDAAARLPGVPVAILGEGPERARLLARARALGVADRLWMPGAVADPRPAMARAAVLALPSDYEGTPGVVREARSVATPVVATDCSPSMAALVGDGGTLVPRRDPAALAAALARWLDPSAVRPAAVPEPGADSATRYLALFDALVRARK